MALELELISPFEVAKEFALAVQEYTLLSAQSLANFFRRPLYMGDMLQQADLIGVGSSHRHSHGTLRRRAVGAELRQHVATIWRGHAHRPTRVARMVTELGPLITGLMVAGRNASGMASELGSMIVTEQIDAMRAWAPTPPRS